MKQLSTQKHYATKEDCSTVKQQQWNTAAVMSVVSTQWLQYKSPSEQSVNNLVLAQRNTELKWVSKRNHSDENYDILTGDADECGQVSSREKQVGEKR